MMVNNNLWFRFARYFDENSKLFGFILILLLYIPYLFTKEESFIGYPFDFLNSNVVWTKAIKDSGMQFAANCELTYPNIMGQPRVVLGSELNFIHLLYYVFPVFWVLVINSLLITLTAYFSFIILLRYLQFDLPKIYQVVIALCFSLMPFWQWGGISIAGFPLVFVILDKIYNKDKIRYYHYIYILFYCFYSNVLVFNVFIYFCVFVYFSIKMIVDKKIVYKFYLSLFFIFVLNLITEYRLFLFAHDPCFLSNRKFLYHHSNFSLNFLFFNLTNGNQHARPLHFPFIGALLFLAIVLLRKKFLLDRIFLTLITIIVSTEIISSNIAAIIINDVLGIDFLAGFSFHRFDIVNQIIWYVLFSYLVLKLIELKNRFITASVVLLIVCQLSFVFKENIQAKNIRSEINPEKFKYNVKFSDYYLIKEYKNIEKFFKKNKKTLKIIHYGIDPAASTYHSYSTTDGFLAIYDKNYENMFNKMLEPRINSNPKLYHKKAFHNYIITENYSAGKNHLQNYSEKPQNLNIDFKILKKTGSDYLISTVPFTNSELSLQGSVKSEFWQEIYIYQVL